MPSGAYCRVIPGTCTVVCSAAPATGSDIWIPGALGGHSYPAAQYAAWFGGIPGCPPAYAPPPVSPQSPIQPPPAAPPPAAPVIPISTPPVEIMPPPPSGYEDFGHGFSEEDIGPTGNAYDILPRASSVRAIARRQRPTRQSDSTQPPAASQESPAAAQHESKYPFATARGPNRSYLTLQDVSVPGIGTVIGTPFGGRSSQLLSATVDEKKRGRIKFVGPVVSVFSWIPFFSDDWLPTKLASVDSIPNNLKDKDKWEKAIKASETALEKLRKRWVGGQEEGALIDPVGWLDVQRWMLLAKIVLESGNCRHAPRDLLLPPKDDKHVKAKEFRAVTQLQLTVYCNEVGGPVTFMSHEEETLMGYTPFNPWDTYPWKVFTKSDTPNRPDFLCAIPERTVYAQGVGYSEYKSDALGQTPVSGHPFENTDKSARVSLLQAFRLGDLANQLNALLTFFYAPYAWARINYALDTSGAFGFGIEASTVPCHETYVDGEPAGKKLGEPVASAIRMGFLGGFPAWIAGPEELIEFVKAGADKLGPSRESYVSPMKKWDAKVVKEINLYE